MRSVHRTSRLPLLLLGVAAVSAVATLGAAQLAPRPAPTLPGTTGRPCEAASAGGDGYTVSGVEGSVVAGLTVRSSGVGGGRRKRLSLQLISSSGPLSRQRPVLVAAASGSRISFDETATPGCYTAAGTPAAGQALKLHGLAATGGETITLRLPWLVRPGAGLIRRARSATLALRRVRELQRVAASDRARPIALTVDYAGTVIRARSEGRLTRSKTPGWRRSFFWMLPGGVALPRRIGSVRYAGRRLAVVSGALRDVDGFIQLLIDPVSGRVHGMRFLAAGHIMHSRYRSFEPAPS